MAGSSSGPASGSSLSVCILDSFSGILGLTALSCTVTIQDTGFLPELKLLGYPFFSYPNGSSRLSGSWACSADALHVSRVPLPGSVATQTAGHGARQRNQASCGRRLLQFSSLMLAQIRLLLPFGPLHHPRAKSAQLPQRRWESGTERPFHWMILQCQAVLFLFIDPFCSCQKVCVFDVMPGALL